MNPTRVVEEIRTFLQSSDQLLTDRVRELADEYAAACREVNGRLWRCAELLGKGLRSEALHLAESEPPLLEQAAVLDFPGRADWDNLAVMYGLPGAQPLQVQIAEELNRAYAAQLPLEDLM